MPKGEERVWVPLEAISLAGDTTESARGVGSCALALLITRCSVDDHSDNCPLSPTPGIFSPSLPK